jgi:hypothetical protein
MSNRITPSNKSILVELRRQVFTAIEVFQEVMSSPTAKTADRLVAAGKIVDTYIKIDKRIDETVLVDQQKRMNALKINKEAADVASSNSGYKSLGVLDIDYDEPTSFS